MSATGLSPQEIAALTARVPCSGSPEIDRIIRVGLRYATASDIMAELMTRFIDSSGSHADMERLAVMAVRGSDALYKQFTKD